MKGFINIGLLLIVAAVSLIGGLGGAYYGNNNLGATVLTTQLADTINTFRTNVNTSLQNINDAFVATTTTDPGHKHTSSSLLGYGLFTSSTLGNASSTNFTVTGFLQVTGASNLTTVSSSNITASGFVQGANANFTNPISIGSGGTAAATFTKGVVTASGTEAFSTVAPGPTGNFLASDGVSWLSSSTFAGSFTSSSVPLLGYGEATSTTPGGDTTSTNSTAFIRISGTTSTFSTAARRVQATFSAEISSDQSAGTNMDFTLNIDGVNVKGDSAPIIRHQSVGANIRVWVSTTWITGVLSAGSHTFQWMAATGAGSVSIVRPYAFYRELY